MAINEPLDTLEYAANALSAKEVMALLQQHGFPEVYETVQGSIEVKGISSLKCQVIKNADQNWMPHVSVEWLSGYVIVPTVAFLVLVQLLGFDGILVTVVSMMLGIGVGGLMLENKKRKTLERLEDALFE
ncbi:MAG: hypothetical protein IT262_00880 [Saprospiraceae bacterium]|nr:hypothetical protein [Saprospiraceae bacterium]